MSISGISDLSMSLRSVGHIQRQHEGKWIVAGSCEFETERNSGGR